MNVVMDADCLIKLTKARIKEEVCRAFRVFIPGNVCREVLRNATEHPECGVVLANLQSGALVEVESRKLAGKGEESVLDAFQTGSYAGIASDDKRFIKKLRILGVPYITPAVFVLLLTSRAGLSVSAALEMLERLAPLISDDEVAVVRLKLESRRREEP